jgi:two-component system response regulator YesN
MSVDYIRYFCVEIISYVSRTLFELVEDADNVIAKRSAILDKVYKTENVFDLKNYLVTMFSEISDYFTKKHNQKNMKVIEKIKKIIEEQYMDSIDVKTISDQVFLSPNYISLIYKKETGESIIEYLTNVRMEAAKNLLKNTDEGA